MAIKYLATGRIQGTTAERTALVIVTQHYADSVGNTATLGSNGATIVSSPTPPSGLGSTCINFDGSNDYLDGYGLMRAMNTAGSISFWFNADADEDVILLSFAESNANTKFEVTTRSSRKLGVQIKIDGTTKWEVTADTLYDAYGNWNHVVITHNGTTAKIYINGTESSYTWSTTTDKTVWWTALRSAVANNFTIGCKALLNSASRTEFYDGQMTDIAFWDSVLPIGTDEDTAGSIKYLYNTGTGRLASTIPTDQTAHYQSPSALEDGTYVLENFGTTWGTASSQYAPTTPTPSNENNYNGVFLNTNSSITGRVLKKIKGYFCLKGSPNTAGSIRLGVMSGTGSGSTITWEEYKEINDDISTLNTGFPAVPVTIEVTLDNTHTLATNDTIALGLTGGNYGSGANVAWNYSDGQDYFDGGSSSALRFTSRNRFSGGAWTGAGMTSDMRCTITTDSDSIKNHGGIGGTSTSAYPNFPKGTIFEDSTNGKHYMWDGTSAWNEMS